MLASNWFGYRTCSCRAEPWQIETKCSLPRLYVLLATSKLLSFCFFDPLPTSKSEDQMLSPLHTFAPVKESTSIISGSLKVPTRPGFPMTFSCASQLYFRWSYTTASASKEMEGLLPRLVNADSQSIAEIRSSIGNHHFYQCALSSAVSGSHNSSRFS